MVETHTATGVAPLYRLELMVPPPQQLAFADTLMSRDDISGFFQQPLQGFSARPGSMTTSEQVAGRKQLVLFVLYCADPWQLLLELRAAASPQWALHFAVSPLLAHGQLAALAPDQLPMGTSQ